MPIDCNTNSKPYDNSKVEVPERRDGCRERESLGSRLAKLLRDTARVLDLEGRSQFK